MKYPKIETLFDRNENTFKVVEGKFRRPEFSLISQWLVTEKIDGTNVRVEVYSDGSVLYKGHTDKAQMQTTLIEWLQTALPPSKFEGVFELDQHEEPKLSAVLYGEGYGVKIQKGGNYRNSGVSFRLFDVAVFGESRVYWLDWKDTVDVASKLGIDTAPFLGVGDLVTCVDWGKSPVRSLVSSAENGNPDYIREGIIAKTEPPLFNKVGQRLMWKLKVKDFA